MRGRESRVWPDEEIYVGFLEEGFVLGVAAGDGLSAMVSVG